jgi:hypothetical protein
MQDGCREGDLPPFREECVSQDYSHELGLLRRIVRGIEKRPISPAQVTQQYLRDHRLARSYPVEDGVYVLDRSADDALDNLVVSLIARSPGMGRGSAFKTVHRELLDTITNYLGQSEDSLDAAVMAAIHSNLKEWFRERSKPHQVFIPCAISPWMAPRFSIGPVNFVCRTDVTRSEFYPADRDHPRQAFDDILLTMEKTRVHWLACVSVEDCDRERGEETAAVAADLALTGLQLILPLFYDTREMSRLDTRRGEADRHSISLSNGTYHLRSTVRDPGLVIGAGTLADALVRSTQWVHAIGSCVTSFATGRFRFPNLELAWCDAAYWLHEALAEVSDAIAYAKLETALEVLARAENTSGSQTRIELILNAFYGLNPMDKLTPESKTTAKQFAKEIVQDRSRILHGTSSTLQPSTGINRERMEKFTIEVIRRVALELEEYATTTAPKDDIGSLLLWVRSKRATGIF